MEFDLIERIRRHTDVQRDDVCGTPPKQDVRKSPRRSAHVQRMPPFDDDAEMIDCANQFERAAARIFSRGSDNRDLGAGLDL